MRARRACRTSSVRYMCTQAWQMWFTSRSFSVMPSPIRRCMIRPGPSTASQSFSASSSCLSASAFTPVSVKVPSLSSGMYSSVRPQHEARRAYGVATMFENSWSQPS